LNFQFKSAVCLEEASPQTHLPPAPRCDSHAILRDFVTNQLSNITYNI